MKKCYIDLHCHTSDGSDGCYTLREVAKKASSESICCLAITDHNFFTIPDVVIRSGVMCVPGAEFDCEFQSRGRAFSIHVLGIFPYGITEDLIEFIEADHRKEIIAYRKAIIARLLEAGFRLRYEDVFEEVPDKGLHQEKLAVARYLQEHGYINRLSEAFAYYGREAGPRQVRAVDYIHYPSLQETSMKIAKNHGIGILAHPLLYKLPLDELETMIHDFSKSAGPFGTMALEAVYAKYDQAQVGLLTGLAEKYGLLISAGGDFHGDGDHFIHGDMMLLVRMLESVRKKAKIVSCF